MLLSPPEAARRGWSCSHRSYLVLLHYEPELLLGHRSGTASLAPSPRTASMGGAPTLLVAAHTSLLRNPAASDKGLRDPPTPIVGLASQREYEVMADNEIG